MQKQKSLASEATGEHNITLPGVIYKLRLSQNILIERSVIFNAKILDVMNVLLNQQSMI